MSTPHESVERDGTCVSRHACLIHRSAGERWTRLADVVRTGLEVDSEPGRGTTVRVRLHLNGP